MIDRELCGCVLPVGVCVVVCYLDGPEKVGFLPAIVHESCDGHSVGEVVDKRHVVDKVVSLTDAQDQDGGNALWDIKHYI